MSRHKDLTGAAAVHPAAHVAGSDPGAVGAHKFWVDTSSGPPYTLKKRNAANDAWETIGGASGASAAEDVTIADAGNDFTATDVEGALAELQADHEADATALADHIADTSDAHDASAISIADAGNDFTATDVEGALSELQADNEAHVAAADPHPGYRLESADHTHASTGAQGGLITGTGMVSTINFVIDGGGAVITTGVKGDIVVDFACTVTAWTVLADVSGSIVVDIWKDDYGNYPPVNADSMTAGEEPTISSATKGQDTSLTGGAGWAITAGQTLRFNVDSCSTITRATVSLKVVRA
jgi:hypothetical protein